MFPARSLFFFSPASLEQKEVSAEEREYKQWLVAQYRTIEALTELAWPRFGVSKNTWNMQITGYPLSHLTSQGRI